MVSVDPYKDLNFTVETPEDFDDLRLPTLDFTLWLEKDNTLNHSYFEKSMRSPYLIMNKSSVGRVANFAFGFLRHNFDPFWVPHETVR